MPKLKIAHIIGKAVWNQEGDIRDVISIGKLVRKNDGPEEVEQIISTMTKYANPHLWTVIALDLKNGGYISFTDCSVMYNWSNNYALI